MTGLACGQDGIKKNHMDILWHEYGARDGNVPIREAGLQARASIVGRLGMMMLAGQNFHEYPFRADAHDLFG